MSLLAVIYRPARGCTVIGKVRLPVEKTISRSGKHAARSVVVVIASDGRVRKVVAEAGRRGRGTYARGSAGWIEVDLGEGDVAVWIRLVRGLRGRVKGRIIVYDPGGRPVLEAVYRRLKIRRSRGDRKYSWAVEAALKALKIDKYVRKLNWGTGIR